MNHPLRLLTVSLLSVVWTSGLPAETVIDQLYGLRNYELADAYYAAGEKFVALGQAERGAEFKARALHLFPGYVPGQAPAVQAVAVAAPVQAAPEPAVPAADVVREKNIQGEKIARLQFQKLLRGYLTGNAAPLLSVLGPTLEVQGDSITTDPAVIQAFFDQNAAEAGSPDELFLLDSLEVADSTNQSVVVTVKANPEALGHLGDLLPFWKPSQEYTFDRVGDTWKLVRIVGR